MRPIARSRAALGLALLVAILTSVSSAAQEPSPPFSPTPSAPSNPSVEGTPPADACVEPEPSAGPVVNEALSIPEEFRIALFNGVWEGIRDFYVDPGTNGLDWDAIGDEYAPLIIATDNAHEVYELLGEMVGRLDDPFTGFFSPDDLGDPATIDPTYVGIGALLDDESDVEVEGLRLIYVFEDSPAQAAGMGPRDRIIAVEGDPCVRIADIRGPEGTDVSLTVVSPGEAPRELTLTRRRVEPTILPVAHRLEADPRVGYLQILSLAGQPAIDRNVEALTAFVESDDPIEALVLDLRASDQGAPRVMTELLRTFVSGDVGEFHSRSGNEPIEIEPDELYESYADMPVVVLVDEGSEAEAEQAAAILQDQARATVIGTQTSGQTHGAQTVDFADGSTLQIVSFGFQLPDGQTLEGAGVTPDIEVDEDWLAYPESDDPFLLAALEVIDDALAGGSGSSSDVEATAAPPASLTVAVDSGTPAG